MKLVLSYLLLAIRPFLRHNSGKLFVAAYEDLDTSIFDPSDTSLFDTDSVLEAQDQEQPLPSFDFAFDGGDQEDILADAGDQEVNIPDLPISPLPPDVNIPQSLAFNVHPPPKGFNPCPAGLKYACCLQVGYYLPYALDCIWFDWDTTLPSYKKFICQDEYIFCCGDIVNGGMKENGNAGNEGINCEPATRSAFQQVQPEQQNQPDWTDWLLKILLFPNPLIRITPPGTAPEGP